MNRDRDRLGYRGRRILVTGAGGSVGAELCRQLARQPPARLLLLDQSEPALHAILTDLPEGPWRPVLGSAGDGALITRLLRDEGVDMIIHAAAYKQLPLLEDNACAAIRNNVLATRTLAEAAAEAGVQRFLLISTDKAEDPVSVLGASKRLAEEIVQEAGRRSPGSRFALVRFGNVLGSSGSVVPRFARQIARRQPLTLTDPAATRYFMSLGQAVSLILQAGLRAENGEALALDMGAPVPILTLAQQMLRLAGLDPARYPIRVTGLRAGEKLHEAPLTGAPWPPDRRLLRLDLRAEPRRTLSAALQDLQRLADAQEEEAAARALLHWARAGDPARLAGSG
ncbi:polysaccharide biosynthesis protein [Pseudooceanicola sp. CBS1P-1]|uniref:NAD-dependent epimerase/dehydratase family protein n=1 Tax=Pseudooceanicola albus TaxID=2692189 RepID=A0A6L7G930_9RHOB|nr:MULTISPECIES: polysaccharide biosynthesis protein [Pseudooceanicola]MBT9385806.1 polysaccharide biosynthesis protein [Pseudooceanicola endophyticus]MXN20038.1 NAD-dependent epimerase/dehydratase family protein [Pseudooceanicola albus]